MTAKPVTAIEKYSSANPVMRDFSIAVARILSPKRQMSTANGLNLLRRPT